MQRIRDNLATIVAGVLVCALVAASFAYFGPWRASHEGDLLAVVHDGEGGTRELPLSRDARVSVAGELGTNVVVVDQGEVRIEEADCPGGDCTRQQPISQPGQQLICLPHRLWVEIVDPDGQATHEMDVDAVSWDESADDVDLVAR